MNKHSEFFVEPTISLHRQYESLRSFYIEGLSAMEVAKRFKMSVYYFNSLRRNFHRACLEGRENYFFRTPKTGPKSAFTNNLLRDQVIALRKKNYSIIDIQRCLHSQNIHLALSTIDKILKDDGFERLPRRSFKNGGSSVPKKIIPQRTRQIDPENDFPTKFISTDGSILIFWPILEALKIEDLIEDAGYPKTSQLSSFNYIMSFLALKLANAERITHSEQYCLDKGIGLFAGLNVLPKQASLSSYSFKINRDMNLWFLRALHYQVQKIVPFSGDINLDFTSIPHWGDESVLENNWLGTRGKALKSVLVLLTQDADTGFLPYSNAEIKHKDKSCAILEFVDFWKTSKVPLNCLIFDSKFTTYANLSKLNEADIAFITLRRRCKSLTEKIKRIPLDQWQTIPLGRQYKRKYRFPKVYEEKDAQLTDYKGTLRQLIITNTGRESPAILITNDKKSSAKTIILKYARRWLIEKSISEQISFFHLNRLSSSIVVKVDFDLTITLLANTAYKMLAQSLQSFEKKTANEIYRKFIRNTARINISYDKIQVKLFKKMHLPILFESTWIKKQKEYPWLPGYQMKFEIENTT